MGHIYRAAYDALEISFLSYEQRISDQLRRYANADLLASFPDYYQREGLGWKLEECKRFLASAKMRKEAEREGEEADAEEPLTDDEHPAEPIPASGVQQFEAAVLQMASIYEQLSRAQPSLESHRRRRIREWWLYAMISAFLLPVLLKLGALVGTFLTNLLKSAF